MLKLIICFTFLLVFNNTAYAGISIPRLKFVHSDYLDYQLCMPKGFVKEEWRPVIQDKVNEIQNYWNSTFQWTMAQSLIIFNKSYPVTEVQVNVHACESVPDSLSIFQRPLMPFLNVSGHDALSIEVFMDGIFREFLKIYVPHALGTSLTKSFTSPLIEKYRALGEKEETLALLHIIAIQKYAYLLYNHTQLPKQAMEFARINAFCSESKGFTSNDACFQLRAWEILETEDVMGFIKELGKP